MTDKTEQEQPGSQTDELDKLLSEASPTQPKVIQEIKDDLTEIKAEFKSNREQRTQEDVNSAVDAMREKVPKAFKENTMFSSEALEDYLTRQAEKDEGLKSAFLGRHKDPSSWEKAKTGLVESFGKQFESIPDANLTEDREAVLASSKTTKPAETEFDEKAVGKMSSEDFNKLRRELLGADT